MVTILCTVALAIIWHVLNRLFQLAALGTFGDLSCVFTVGRVYFVNDNWIILTRKITTLISCSILMNAKNTKCWLRIPFYNHVCRSPVDQHLTKLHSDSSNCNLKVPEPNSNICRKVGFMRSAWNAFCIMLVSLCCVRHLSVPDQCSLHTRFKHKNPEDTNEVAGGFLSNCNKNSLEIIQAYGDMSLNNAHVYSKFQFERNQFFSVDPDTTHDNVSP